MTKICDYLYLRNAQAVVTLLNPRTKKQVSSMFSSVGNALAYAELTAKMCPDFKVVVHKISSAVWDAEIDHKPKKDEQNGNAN